VILIGNLGSDPELRYTATNIALLSLRVATNESYLDRNKELQERTEWHNIIVWGGRAEALSKTLTKGAYVLVEGSLRTSSFEKDGIRRYKTEVHARDVTLIGKRGPMTASEIVGVPSEGAASPIGATRGSGFLTPKKEELLDELPY
jgi:single-strand DNA-binding protein